MRILNIIKVAILLVISLLILVPGWIHYFDKGHSKTTIRELIAKDSKIKSKNLEITGIGLFEESCRFEELRDNGSLANVLWYVPFVSDDWTVNDNVPAIIIFDSGKRDWDQDFEQAVLKLDKKIDSLSSTIGEIKINVTFKKYDMFKWEKDALNCVFSESELKYKNNMNLIKLEFNGKESFFGKLFMTFFVMALGIIIFLKLK